MELSDYYTVVAPHMALHVVGYAAHVLLAKDALPLQKDSCAGVSWLEPRRTDVGELDCVVEDERGIVSLAQRGMVEMRTGLARYAEPRPRLLLFALAPDPIVEFRDVIECANRLRSNLEREGLECFAQTRQAQGLDVCAPLVPNASFEEVRHFAARVAKTVARELPLLCTTECEPDACKGRIEIDVTPNSPGGIRVAAYSAHLGQDRVSLPVEWDELVPRFDPAEWSLAAVARRMARVPEDPFAHVISSARSLPVPGGRRVA